jgi:hypothetical protein
MKQNGGCKAVRYSDQMCCGKCGLQWDVNDPDPPFCGPSTQPIVVKSPDNFRKDVGYGKFKSNGNVTGSI